MKIVMKVGQGECAAGVNVGQGGCAVGMGMGQGECPVGIKVGQGECAVGMGMGQGERPVPGHRNAGREEGFLLAPCYPRAMRSEDLVSFLGNFIYLIFFPLNNKYPKPPARSQLRDTIPRCAPLFLHAYQRSRETLPNPSLPEHHLRPAFYTPFLVSPDSSTQKTLSAS